MRFATLIIVIFFSSLTVLGQSLEISLPLVHEKEIHIVDFSENGEEVMTCATDQTVKIWDVRTGALLKTLMPNNGSITMASFVQNGATVLTSGTDPVTMLTNWQTGEELMRLPHQRQLIAYAMNAKGSQLAMAELLDSVVRIWEVGEKPRLIKEVRSEPIKLLSFRKDELIISDLTGKVSMVSSASERMTFQNPQQIEDIRWSDDGAFMYCMAYDSTYVWDLKNGEMKNRISGRAISTDPVILLDDVRLLGYDPLNKIQSEVRRFDQSVVFTQLLDRDEYFVILEDGRAERISIEAGKTLKAFQIDRLLGDIQEIRLKEDLLLVTQGNTFAIWNVQQGGKWRDFNVRSSDLTDGTFFMDEKTLVTINEGNAFWTDLKNTQLKVKAGSQISSDRFHDRPKKTMLEWDDKGVRYWIDGKSYLWSSNGAQITDAVMSPDKGVFAVLFNGHLNLYSAVDQNKRLEISRKGTEVTDFRFSSDGELIAVYLGNRTLEIIDLGKKKAIVRKKGFDKSLRYMEFSPENDQLILVFGMSKVPQLLDVKTKKIIELKGHGSWVYRAHFNGGELITTSRSGKIFVWDRVTNALEKQIDAHSDRVSHMTFTPDRKCFATGSRDQKIRIWHAETYECLFTLSGHQGWITSLCFNDTGDQLLSTSKDGSWAVWDVRNGKELYRQYILQKDGFRSLLLLPDNYYMDQGRAVHELSYLIDNEVYSFEQFDLKYNRPDIVLERLGYASPEKIEQYRKAYEKRLQKMGFKEEMLKSDFHLPETKIVNAEELAMITAKGYTDLNVHLSDTKYPLDRINLWVNSVPIYGVDGISLRDRMVQEFDTTIHILLNEGQNKIEVSVLNQAGAESYKETVTVECTKKAPKPNLYFVGIGVKDYADESMNLKYSDKDIADVAKLYAKNSNYGKVFIDTFLNTSVTKAILPKIRKRLASTTVHDQVILMYSGHGVLDRELDYYLTTHDMDFSDPKENGLLYDEVDGLLDGIPARQKLILIDACNSGEVDKEDTYIDTTAVAGVSELEFSKAGLNAVLATSSDSYEVMKEIFTDLRRGTGATVISSSSGLYYSFEDENYQNGIYTYALKLGLQGEADTNNDQQVTVSELTNYLYQKVSDLTNGRQQPNTRQENLEFDFRVY